MLLVQYGASRCALDQAQGFVAPPPPATFACKNFITADKRTAKL